MAYRVPFWPTRALGASLLLPLLACVGSSSPGPKGPQSPPADNLTSIQAVEYLTQQLQSSTAEEAMLLRLDRGQHYQKQHQYMLARADVEIADGEMEWFDFAHSTVDSLVSCAAANDAGSYRAPLYEMLMLNTTNLINYLASGDLKGAEVEARRFLTWQDTVAARAGEKPASLALASYLAGYTFELTGELNTALHHYDDALKVAPLTSFFPAIARVAGQSTYRTSRLQKVETELLGTPPVGESGSLLIVVNYGRVPKKVAKRVNIGAAVLAGGHLMGSSAKLQAEDLLDIVNYPELAPSQRMLKPMAWLDQAPVELEEVLNLEGMARAEWKAGKAGVMACALLRTGIRMAGVKVLRDQLDNWPGWLPSFFGKNTLLASVKAAAVFADTPDTRAWNTLPARVAIKRISLSPGVHEFKIQSPGGDAQMYKIDMPVGGWGLVNLTTLGS